MAFKELVSPTLKELFVKELEAMILSGELKIGEKLPTERELAEKMKVSQAVINGGILELANKGFLDVVPRKGTYVADYKRKGKIEILQSLIIYNGGRFDPEMMNQLLVIRECIESNIVFLAAQQASVEDIEKLKTIFNKLNSTNDLRERSEVSVDFFHELSIISGNIIHPLIYYSFYPIFLPWTEILYKNGFLKIELDLIRKLIDLIEQKKPEEAANCISEKINHVRNIMNTTFTPGQKLI